jgi:hypothetical protein
MNAGDSKWKDALLKTSLPLEYLVANKLSEQDCYIYGEFSYSRGNEQGIATEFSVDLRASKRIKKGQDATWGELNLLVECKYNYPGVKWVFSPMAKGAEPISGVVNTFYDLCTRRIPEAKAINEIDTEMPFCVKGLELHQSNANSQSIERGLHQLRWALPQLASEILRKQATTIHDDDLQVGMLCPILVTTASLHVFRQGLELNEFLNASDLEAITEQVDALVVSRERGPQLDKYLRDIIEKLHKDTPSIKERLSTLADIILTPGQRRYFRPSWHYDLAIGEISTRILVVNYAAFDNVIADILRAIEKSGDALKRYAVLIRNAENNTAKIEPYLQN